MTKNRKTLLLENCLQKHMRFNNERGVLESTIHIDKKNCDDYEIVDGLSVRIENDKEIWFCYEVKSSKMDFNSSASWTFVGHYNYFVMDSWLFDQVKDKIPNHIGVLAPVHREDEDDYILRCIKEPIKCELKVDEIELRDSIFRSFDREVHKGRKRIKNTELNFNAAISILRQSF